MTTPPLLWTPTQQQIATAEVTEFARWVAEHRDVGDHHVTNTYHALWEWSVDDLEGFWSSIWERYGVIAHDRFTRVLGSRDMPGAKWFPGATLNYAENLFARKPLDRVAIHHTSELSTTTGTWTWGDLRTQTARIRAGLVEAGVGKGDRVAAYMPNIPDTIAAFLATASLGAIWSSAAPEFGAKTVVDRFKQIEPKVLLAIDGYRYGGKDFDRREITEQIATEIGARLVRFGLLDGSDWEPGFADDTTAELEFEPVPFEHPLWILYSSGTTGLPKAIVHSQGGILLEQLKKGHLHLDARAGDRFFWFTTTGWMMWNFLVGVLHTDAEIVLFDGNPATPTLDRLWDMASELKVTSFGTSAGFINAWMKAGIEPRRGRNLSALRSLGSTGSPLSSDGFDWIYDQLGPDLWLFSTSGGTDVCTAFVGGVPTLPVYEGELQGPALGAALESWDPDGKPLIGEVGELVLTKPMPSMPVSFWGDEDGTKLREAYFDYFPGVWRHGDWITITERGSAVISGRSDATINRGGVRMGTAEIYSVVLAQPEITDAVVVDLPREDTDGEMLLFVVTTDGEDLSDEAVGRLRSSIRSDCSPRHVPDEIIRIDAVPRTLSGKVLEVPVKRILMGTPPEQAASRESLANPEALDAISALAARRRG